MNKFAIVCFSIIGLLAINLAACSSTSSTPGLSGTSWKLVSYGPQGQQVTAAQGVTTWITFDAEGSVSGSLGCNQFSGEYKIKGSTIEFGPIMSTLMACPEPQMSQESSAFQVLTGTVDFEMSGDQLIIQESNGSVSLVFTRLFEQ